MGFLIVFIGGGIGAALRHGFNLIFARLLGTAFPHATLFENVSGSIVMGVLVALFAFRSGIPHHWQLFLTTGILGGCARAVTGHAAAPPRNVMNSRRLMQQSPGASGPGRLKT